MRVLFVSDTPVAPATAGNRRRVAALQAWLRGRGATVGMLLIPGPDGDRGDPAAMRAALDDFAVAPIPPVRPSLPVRALRRLWPAAPLPLDAWCPPAVREATAAFAARWRSDVVVAHYVYLSACLPALRPRCFTVLDTQDVMHRRRAAYRTAGLRAQWFHTTRGQERRGLRRADLVLAIQARDAAAFAALVGREHVLTVAHAEPLRLAPPAAARPARLLLVASWNDLNVVGLRWFLDGTWPAVRAAVPTAELHVCGTIAAKLDAVPAGVVVRGVVPDLDEAYAGSRVVIAPVPSGTGLKVKVVEALAHGRPVVATSAGADGVEHGAAHGIVVADDPATFASAVIGLLTDETRWRALTAAAAEHARRYAPDAVFAPLWERFVAGAARNRSS